MFTFLIIALPVLFIVVGTVAALSLSRDAAPHVTLNDEQSLPIPAVAPEPESGLFRPSSRRRAHDLPALGELLGALQANLRAECEAARTFTLDPSLETLWAR